MAFSKRAAKVKEQIAAEVVAEVVTVADAPGGSAQSRAAEELRQEPDRADTERADRERRAREAEQERDRADKERAERELRAREAEQEELARRRQAALEARRVAEEEERRRKVEPTGGLRPAGSLAAAQRQEGGFGAGGGGGGGFSWKKGGAAPQQPMRPVATFGKGSARAPAVNPRFAGLASHDDCELGVSAIVSKTQNGMKEGLRCLGLPDFPLVFVPGKSMWLCGHDVREEVNGMIHAWMTNDTDDFYKSLAHIKEIVAKPRLTEEEYEMMDHAQKAKWVATGTRGPDGTALYASRTDAATAGALLPPKVEDDDDDEVIDVSPAGVPLQVAGDAAADAQTPAVGQQASAERGAGTDVEDYYSVLGVDQGAGVQEIRSKFRALITVHHPEKGGDRKTFQSLNKAYSVLVDQKKRQEFDALLASRSPAAASGGYPAKAFVD